MTILRNFGSIEQALAHSLKHLKEEEVKSEELNPSEFKDEAK